MLRQNLVRALEFNRSVQGLTELTELVVADDDDLFLVLDVHARDADAQPKKITLQGVLASIVNSNQGITVPRNLVIADPKVGDNFTLFRTVRETSLEEVVALVSSGSVTYEIYCSADRSVAGTIVVPSNTVTSNSFGDAVTPVNQPIPAFNWVWVELLGVVDTPTEFTLSLAF